MPDAVSNKPGHRGTAGVVGAENLSQEHPERHDWREDSAFPADPDRLQRLREEIGREDISKRELTFLQELTSYESDLLTKSSLTGKWHVTGLLACDGSSISIINVGKPGIADLSFSKKVPTNLRAIRRSDRSAQATAVERT
jgi:hypothetical protein